MQTKCVLSEGGCVLHVFHIPRVSSGVGISCIKGVEKSCSEYQDGAELWVRQKKKGIITIITIIFLPELLELWKHGNKLLQSFMLPPLLQLSRCGESQINVPVSQSRGNGVVPDPVLSQKPCYRVSAISPSTVIIPARERLFNRPDHQDFANITHLPGREPKCIRRCNSRNTLSPRRFHSATTCFTTPTCSLLYKRTYRCTKVTINFANCSN